MRRLAQDFRVALRGIRRAPAFTITVVLILGIAIGMAVAMYTVFDAVLLRRLPVVDQDRVVELWPERQKGIEFPLVQDDVDLLRRQSRTMTRIAAFGHWGAYAFPLADGDRSLVLPQARVSGNFFEVLGARPLLGRLLRGEDDAKGAPLVVVLSYDAWKRQFNGDSSVIGHRLHNLITQDQYTIVGVAPPGLDYPVGTGYWQGFGATYYQGLDFVARLAPGATTASAAAELYALMQREHPDYNLIRAEVHTLTQAVVGNVRPVLIALIAAVALLLAIACVNVGNLLLLRAASRAREITIRRALGASFGDVAQQLLVESVVLGAAGGAAGLAFAMTLLRALLAFAPARLPRADMIALSATPVAAAIGITVLAVVIFGVFPALSAARGDLGTTLRLDSRSGTESRTRRRTRQVLVASQVALALVMIAGAGLLVRSLERLERQNLGYTPDHLAILEMTFPFSKYNGPAKYYPLFERAFARLRRVPGVTSLSPILIPPFIGPNVWQWKPELEGATQAEAAATPMVPVEAGGAEYFRTMGIPIVRGRGFTDADRANAPYVAVVSEALARRLWPGQDPLGKRFRFGQDSARWRTVVGVASDIRYRSLRDAAPTLFMPWRQSDNQGLIAIRSDADLAALLPSLRAALVEVEPELKLWRARTMNEHLAGPLAQPRMSTLLMTGFGLVALVLAAVGLYGVMAFAVREQTREIGVRMALGATPDVVRREVLSGALRMTGWGAAVGLAGALLGSRLLTTLLFEVSPADPITFAGACLVLLGVGLLAAYLPARRATRIDPAQALRAE